MVGDKTSMVVSPVLETSLLPGTGHLLTLIHIFRRTYINGQLQTWAQKEGALDPWAELDKVSCPDNPVSIRVFNAWNGAPGEPLEAAVTRQVH